MHCSYLILLFQELEAVRNALTPSLACAAVKNSDLGALKALQDMVKRKKKENFLFNAFYTNSWILRISIGYSYPNMLSLKVTFCHVTFIYEWGMQATVSGHHSLLLGE